MNFIKKQFKKMKKLVFLPLLLAIMVFTLGCEQSQLPWHRSSCCGNSSHSDLNYFSEHYGFFNAIRPFSWSNDKSVKGSRPFDKKICVAANHSNQVPDELPNVDTPEEPGNGGGTPEEPGNGESSIRKNIKKFAEKDNSFLYRKFVYARFESGDLKEAYITSKAYVVERKGGEGNNVVYIKMKSDNDQFIGNVLKPFFNAKDSAYVSETPDLDYITTVKTKATIYGTEDAKKVYDKLLIGTVSSPAIERGFRNWVKSKNVSLKEIN
jgi:hypothetical protein